MSFIVCFYFFSAPATLQVIIFACNNSIVFATVCFRDNFHSFAPNVVLVLFAEIFTGPCSAGVVVYSGQFARKTFWHLPALVMQHLMEKGWELTLNSRLVTGIAALCAKYIVNAAI